MGGWERCQQTTTHYVAVTSYVCQMNASSHRKYMRSSRFWLLLRYWTGRGFILTFLKQQCRDCNCNCKMTPLSVYVCTSLTRAAQAAVTCTQGVLTSHNNYITKQIARSTSQNTVSTKRHIHRRRHNWGRAIISQYVGDVRPMTISAQSCS